MDPITVIVVVIATFVVVHTVSVEMRLADLTRRLESEERSTERLSKVWWQGMYRRYGVEPEDEMRDSHR